MVETLIPIAAILGVAWLLDLGWSMCGHPPQIGHSQPKSRYQSAKLRRDWLRLGPRSK